MTRPEVTGNARELHPYVPGRTVEEIAAERGLDPSDVVKLSSNENPLGPPPAALEALCELRALHRYPSPDLISSFERAASEHVGVSPGSVVVTPGADGAIDHLCRLFVEDGTVAAAPVPTFQYYRAPVVVNGGRFVEVETDVSRGRVVTDEVWESIVDEGPDVVFLCSPNNPTGVPVGDAALRAAIESGALVVLDEAYAEFSTSNRAPLVEGHENLVVLRTTSKAFGLAGLRVGYAVVPEWMKGELGKVATPFSVNSAGLAAAEAALRDTGHLRETLETVRRGREYLAENLPFASLPSEANFVAIDVSPLTAGEVEEGLLDRGVIVRSCESFPGDTENLVRVSVGTEEENRRAVAAAEDLLEEW